MILWDSSLATGHKLVDEDHQKLINALNELETVLGKGADTKRLVDILSFLITYTHEHFAREENLMRCVHCPALGENIKAHSMLLIRLSEWVPRLYKPGTRELAREIFTELTTWIQNHILRVDCQLRHCLSEKTEN